MKLKGTLLAIGLSCISISIYAADQVIKEETTPPSPAGAITTDQIQPVYTPPGAQAEPAANPTTSSITTVPVPGQAMPGAPQQPVMQTAPASNQNMAAPPRQPMTQPAPKIIQPVSPTQSLQPTGQGQPQPVMQQNTPQQPAPPTG